MMKRLLAIIAVLFSNVIMAQKSKLIIGTYTSGKSEGIYVYDFNSSNGNSKFISSVKSSNPSFLAVSPDKNYLYAVNEDADSLNNGGMISAFKFDKKKKHLSFINQQTSGGNHPCYVTVDKTGKWVIAANYTGGSFSVTAVDAAGGLSADKKVTQHTGKSINKDRQEKAHVHTTVLNEDNKHLLVADLGIDKLLLYDFDAVAGTATLNEKASVTVSGGSGPRHVAIHPSQRFVYLTEELSGTVAAFNIDAEGKLKLFQTISAVPENYKGSLGGADIHVAADGRFLYASNRGELNDLVIFAIDTATGVLTTAGHQSTLGVKPRNFNFDPSGNFLLVANQDSDSIIVFSVNHETGLLTDTGKKITVPNPVCLLWVK